MNTNKSLIPIQLTVDPAVPNSAPRPPNTPEVCHYLPFGAKP